MKDRGHRVPRGRSLYNNLTVISFEIYTRGSRYRARPDNEYGQVTRPRTRYWAKTRPKYGPIT